MLQKTASLACDVQCLPSRFCHIVITIPAYFVRAVYDQACAGQQNKAHAHGFAQGPIPRGYIERNYRTKLLDHVKEFLFNYFVISFLFEQMRTRKLLIVGEPRLKNAQITDDDQAIFEFECTLSDELSLNTWKHFPFKAPQRKKYRDIDRQVETFITQEEENKAHYGTQLNIHLGDLVCFDIWLIDEKNKPVLGSCKETLWLKIGTEESDTLFHELFLAKKIGDVFFSNNHALQEYFSYKFNEYARFGIEIVDIIAHDFFCFKSFKDQFRSKTNKEMRSKLTEVFSFRNDVSQRRLMTEGALALVLKHHQISLPGHALLRQQQIILDHLSLNPDYPVYKAEQDFNYKIEQLAIKQLKETILIDAIAYNENIAIEHADVADYLNLTKRPRTKEFIYFILPRTKIGGQETPIPAHMLKQCCLREKTLNYIIYHLTKK